MGVDLRDNATGSSPDGASTGCVGIDITTGPYPGFATDLQAPVMALLATAAGPAPSPKPSSSSASGTSTSCVRMGASIAVRGRTAVVRGVERLQGAAVTCTDVRAAAALVIAGLGAEGRQGSSGLDHLDRGYDRMVRKLAALRRRHRAPAVKRRRHCCGRRLRSQNMPALTSGG